MSIFNITFKRNIASEVQINKIKNVLFFPVENVFDLVTY